MCDARNVRSFAFAELWVVAVAQIGFETVAVFAAINKNETKQKRKHTPISILYREGHIDDDDDDGDSFIECTIFLMR